jgi:glycosyltransferase involved in cell wall biosynthesis
MTYLAITPVRNERDHFARTIASMEAQTIRPCFWVIVDDGSSDGTGDLADQAAREHDWIRVVHRPDRGARKQGGGVIEAFYDGFALVADEPWDYLVKLDGDLGFDADYFQRCLERFAADTKLGIGGGNIWCDLKGIVYEDGAEDPPFHVRGATKIYRRATWDAIDGIARMTGWDTLDELKANMLGWRTYKLKDIRIWQLKATGSADGDWRNWTKNGLANYIAGYHPLFMCAKCLRRLVRTPSLLQPLGLGWGFLKGYALGAPRIPDRQLVTYVRQQQLNRLLGKPSLWD